MNDLWYLLIEITQKCNARCEHCGSNCDINCGENLSKDDILRALKDIKENIGTDIMINISGGEPLMRGDLFDIMTEVSRLGFDWGMVTNGVLISDQVIDKMRSSGMKTITVSIDGLKETHESIRHLPGSYERIMNNLRKLKKAHFLDHIQVTFTSNHRNVYEFPQLYEELCKIGIDSVRTSCVDPIGRANGNRDLLLRTHELKFMIDYVNHINKSKRVPVIWGCCHYFDKRIKGRIFSCFAGIHSASILSNGDIFVCTSVPRRPELIHGNIKTDSFSKVWESGFEFARNRDIAYCKGCKYLTECKGDSLHTWDFDKGVPIFCYKKKFDVQTRKFEQYVENKYGRCSRIFIGPNKKGSNIYVEPDAYQYIRTYFHMGEKNPLSMYEQQVGLVGFKVDDDYVIKYAFPSYMATKDEKTAVFTRDTLRYALKQSEIIRHNFPDSGDKEDYIGGGLRFLGFAHSHPAQADLCYSIGDEMIHHRLEKKFGDYIGILINPSKDLIGAYYGKEILQGNLILLKRKQ